MSHGKPWVNHYDPEVAHEIPEVTGHIFEHFENCARRLPEKVALQFLHEEYTYHQLQEKIIHFSNCLHDLGLRPGQRVALILPNCPEYVISYYAILRCGGIVIQISPFYKKSEISKIITDSQAHTVITLDLLSGRIHDLKDNMKIENVVLVSLKSHLSWWKSIFYSLKLLSEPDTLDEDYLNEVFTFEHLMEQTAVEIDPKPGIKPEDHAVYQYTGGTTGVPKGAILTHGNIISDTSMIHLWLGGDPEQERTLAVIPFFHSYGMTVAMNFTLLGGGTLVTLPRFTVGECTKKLIEENITFFPCLPAILNVVASHVKHKNLHFDRESLKVISGAAPLPSEVRKVFESATGATVVEGFGLSECSPVTHCNPVGQGSRLGSIGMPLPSTDSRIVDLEDDSVLGVEEVGELIIRGPQVMQGYFSHKHEVEKVIFDGWLYTGDLAKMDAEGYFYIVGRRKNMIIRSGLKIYPNEIEDLLLQVEGVKDVAVAGIPDTATGEVAAAWVVTQDDHALVEKACRALCNKKLATYKQPVQYFFIQAIPKNMLGKTLHKDLLIPEDS